MSCTTGSCTTRCCTTRHGLTVSVMFALGALAVLGVPSTYGQDTIGIQLVEPLARPGEDRRESTTPPDTRHPAAWGLLVTGDAEAAHAAFTKADAGEGGGSFETALGLGLSLRYLGRLDDSADAARRALTLAATDRERVLAHDLLAFSLHDAAVAPAAGSSGDDPRLAEAARSLAEAARLAGPDASRSLDQATVALRRGDVESMIRHRAEAVGLGVPPPLQRRLAILPVPGDDGAFVPGHFIAQPTRLETPAPQITRSASVAGTITVRIVVDAEGRVPTVEIVESVAPEVDAATVDAMQNWTFEPSTLFGTPVPVAMTFTMTFGNP